MRTLHSKSPVGASLLCLLLLGASCAAEEAEQIVASDEPAGAGDGMGEPLPDEDEPAEPDPEEEVGPALPACPGADESYLLVAGDTEVVDYFGPNISVILGGDEVAVLYPSVAEYGTGSWDFPDVSQWSAELCVDWSDSTSSCGSVLYPSAGSLQITQLDEDEVLPTKVNGRFVAAIFVDNPSNPSCQAKVDLAFSAGI